MGSDLRVLLSRVKAATGPDRELDADLVAALVSKREAEIHRVHGLRLYDYTASIDATLALALRKLGDGWFSILLDAMREFGGAGTAPPSDLPRYVLAALLTALDDDRAGMVVMPVLPENEQCEAGEGVLEAPAELAPEAVTDEWQTIEELIAEAKITVSSRETRYDVGMKCGPGEPPAAVITPSEDGYYVRAAAYDNVFDVLAEVVRRLPVASEPIAAETAASDDETEMTWRDLALQFDAHRMDALAILRWIDRNGFAPEVDDRIEAFLAAPPLSGESVLAQRLRALSIPGPGRGALLAKVNDAEIGYRPHAVGVLLAEVRDFLSALEPAPTLPEGDVNDATLAAACRKHNIGTVNRLDEVVSGYRGAPTLNSTGEPAALTEAEIEQLILATEPDVPACVDGSTIWTKRMAAALHRQLYASEPVKARSAATDANEREAYAVWHALLSCSHTITGEEIVIRQSPRQTGNAAWQAYARIKAALASLNASGEK